MSQRERWIIYPLLFLTFCLAFRDQSPLTRTKDGDFSELVCRNLTVVDEKGVITASIGSRSHLVRGGSGASSSGQLKIYTHAPGDVGSAPTSAVVLSVSDDLRGVVQTKGQTGMPLLELTGDNAGQRLVFFDEQNGKQLSTLRLTNGKPDAEEGGVTLTPSPPESSKPKENPRTAKPRPPMPPEEGAHSA